MFRNFRKQFAVHKAAALRNGSVAGLVAASAMQSAFATTAPTALPITSVSGAQAAMVAAGLIAVGVASAITVIVLSLKSTKLPRKA